MKIRCIAIDLDDTLLRTDLTIDPVDQEAIKKASAAGISVMLASGRMMQSMRPYVELLGLDLPLIAYNGAIIQEAKSKKVLFHRPVPNEAAVEVLNSFKEAGLHLNAYINDQLFMEELTDWGKLYAKNAGVSPHAVGDQLVELLAKEASHKLLGLGEKAAIDAIQGRLQQQWGEKLQFVKSKPNYLEILAPGVSKGNALQELINGWGWSREEVMAIGDAPNDLSMIKWAGIGVAIGNACELVKSQADLIVADHDHQGVAAAIQQALAS